MRFRLALLLLALAAPAGAQPAADCTADVEVGADLKINVHLQCGRAEPGSYRVDLMSLPQSREVIVRGQGVLATLGSWLRTPEGLGRAPSIDIRVKTAPGLVFAAGLPRVGDAWRLDGTSVRFAGYTAIGRLSLTELDGLRLAILDGVGESGRADLVDWVRRTAEAQANYWQGFQAPGLLVGLVPTPMRRAVGYGRAVSGGGPTIMVEIGPQVDRRHLFDDWVLVHEMVHIAMPFIRGRATWFMEGAATYVEPIIRARAGWKTEEEVWREWIDNMPRGVQAFANGLQTASGGQNYWAGALFMLMADVAIRRETEGARGLEDCLGGALRSGFDAARRVGLEEYAAACGRATGTTSLGVLLERHVARGEPVDLALLWRELGVALVGERIVLDDTAPLARWRKQIVMGLRPTTKVKLPWES